METGDVVVAKVTGVDGEKEIIGVLEGEVGVNTYRLSEYCDNTPSHSFYPTKIHVNKDSVKLATAKEIKRFNRHLKYAGLVWNYDLNILIPISETVEI